MCNKLSAKYYQEKEKKQKYSQEHYKNLSEDEKNKLVEYKKKS